MINLNSRIIGSNAHGFANEAEMVNHLNGKKYSELNTNLKEFINTIAADHQLKLDSNMTIKAEEVKSNRLKQDFIITFLGQVFYISLKMGSGNSVHQEKVEEFITYLKSNFKDVTSEICDDMRLLIWADGTLDGKAPIDYEGERVKGRFTGREFRKMYPKKQARIQQFFDKNQRGLINHVLFIGKNNSRVDYIYYGTPTDGVLISAKEIIEYNIENPIPRNGKEPAFLIGRMSLQSWNVSLQGTAAGEKKRGQVQIKYSKLKDDFDTILKKKLVNKGTFIGDKEEFDLSRVMNKNKKHPYWTVLTSHSKVAEDDLSNSYIVRVTKNVKSSLSNTSVMPKSDDYVINANLDHNYLLSKNFILTEDNLPDFKYNIVPRSGISVKLLDSKNFTIVKLTPNSFLKAFKDLERPELVLAGLLIYSKEKDMVKNSKILKDLSVLETDLINYTNTVTIQTVNDLASIEDAKIIRKTMQIILRDYIESNPEIKKALFTGEGWFPDPYFTSYMYKNGGLTDEVIYDYSITTGSGRSKGNYTIVLKPKN